MKKCVAVLVVLVMVCAGVFVASSGFSKRTDVLLMDYDLSENGAVTLRTALPTSMGYIRDMAVRQEGEGLYCSFYNAFGGLNSSLGAKSAFTVTPDDSCRAIYFDRGSGGYELVLARSGADGAWTER